MRRDVYRLAGRRNSRFAGYIKQHAKMASVLVTGLVVSSMAGAVFAIIPDSNGTVHACYNTMKGDLRVIDSPSQQCKSGETPINLATPGGSGSTGVGQLVTTDFSNANLNGFDMRYRNFHGLNFTNASLSGVNLSHSDVGSANFSGADLTGSIIVEQDLTSSTLTNTNFTGSTLRAVSFGSNGLSGTNLNMTNMYNVTGLAGRDFVNGGFTAVRVRFNDTDLTGANFAGIDLAPFMPIGLYFGAYEFNTANLTNVNFTGVTHSNTNEGNLFFSNSDLTGTKFVNAAIPGYGNAPMFDHTTGTGTNFTGADIRGADFSGASLTNANFTDTNLSRGAGTYQLYPNFNGATLTNPNFTNTNLQTAHGMDTATIVNATWSNTTCPDASNSDANGGTCVGHFTPAS